MSAGGELDLAAASALSTMLRAAATTRGAWVYLDLADTTFLDCACLGVLVAAGCRLRHLGGGLVLTSVSGVATRTLVLAGLDEELRSRSRRSLRALEPYLP